MKKRIVSLAAGLLLFCACSKATATIDGENMAQQMMNGDTFVSSMILLDQQQAEAMYPGIEEAAEDFWIAEADGMEQEVLIIAKMKDQKKMETLVEQRLKEMKQAAENYFPEQVEQVDNAWIETDGTYMIAAVAKDVSELKRIWNEK